MKASDIITQLRAVVPQYDSSFGESISATITQSAGVATATTSSPHGLSVNDIFSVSGAKTNFEIDLIEYIDGICVVTTVNSHDLTSGYQSEITISGADQAAYNGTFALGSVYSRTQFSYTPDSAPSVTPATGTMLMTDPLNEAYRGAFVVASVPTTTTFTFALSSSPESPAGGSPYINIAPRITGGVDMQRILNAYTKQTITKNYAFVILDDVTTSRDRDVKSDAVAEKQAGNTKRLRLIEPFTIYVVIPTADEEAARAARDSIDSIFAAFNRALFGWKAPSIFSDRVWSECVPTAHAFASYNGAYYVHRFDYERQVDLVQDDAKLPDYSVAFRDMNISFQNSFDEVIMETDIDLDTGGAPSS